MPTLIIEVIVIIQMIELFYWGYSQENPSQSSYKIAKNLG